MTGGFMDKKFFILVILGIIVGGVLLFWTRFQIVPVHAMNGVGFYKISRISGEMTLVSGLEQIKVLNVKDFEIPAQVPGPAPVQPETK
jgi:hypothetical protein